MTPDTRSCSRSLRAILLVVCGAGHAQLQQRGGEYIAVAVILAILWGTQR